MIKTYLFAIVLFLQSNFVNCKAKNLIFEVGLICAYKEKKEQNQPVVCDYSKGQEKIYYNILYRDSNGNKDIELAKYERTQNMKGENFKTLPMQSNNVEWKFKIEVYENGKLIETHDFNNSYIGNSTLYNQNDGISLTRRSIYLTNQELDDIQDSDIQVDEPFGYESTIRVYLGLKYRDQNIFKVTELNDGAVQIENSSILLTIQNKNKILV